MPLVEENNKKGWRPSSLIFLLLQTHFPKPDTTGQMQQVLTLQLHISRYEDIGYGVARQLLISGGGEKRVISPQTEERREDSEESNRWTYANGFDSEYSTIPGAGFESGYVFENSI